MVTIFVAMPDGLLTLRREREGEGKGDVSADCVFMRMLPR